MRKLSVFFLLFLCLMVPSYVCAGTPASTGELLHLSVKATGVRLRAGAGTEFAIVGMASRNDAAARHFIAYIEPRMDSVGMLWFKLVGSVQKQEDMAVFKIEGPCWIRSDFVETRALNETEKARADSVFFRVLDFAPRMLTSFRPAEALPAYSDEKLCFFPQEADASDLSLPAGEEYLILNVLQGKRACVGLWRALDDSRIRFAGSVPLDLFMNADFGNDREKVEGWLKKQPVKP